jgi:DNA (cytosine-5)-methyltransferase 1
MAAPWRTVRDAISDLPHPENIDLASSIPNHVYIPGARSYPGHTGSPLDEPAKTLKAGVHGVPGGENMLVQPSGEVRYFTVREAARLQTFPDDYYFPCSWGESMRQIGNAVPVHLAYIIASSINKHLHSFTESINKIAIILPIFWVSTFAGKIIVEKCNKN